MRRSLAVPVTLVASLLVPGLLVGGWVWLRHGGRIEAVRAEEERAATAALTATATGWRDALTELARSAPPREGVVRLTLREGLPIAPFAGWPKTSSEVAKPAPLSLELAREHAARGESERALSFFDHLGLETVLAHDPQNVLSWARLLARVDGDAARDLLARARAVQPSPRTAPIPFALLTQVVDAKLAADRGDRAPARALQEQVMIARPALPAAAIGPVFDVLARLADRPEPAAAAALRSAAILALNLSSGRSTVPTELTLGPNGDVLVPYDGALAVVTAARARRAGEQATEQQQRAHPELRLTTGDDPDALASAELPGLAVTLCALPTGVPTSERLAQLANLLLVLAAVAFFCGNLAMSVLVRREIAVSRMKTDFVDLVSHELRTPLTALSLKTEMLATDAVPPERRMRYVRTLHREVERLGHLVRRVLDFGRLQRGRAALRLERVEVRTLLAKALREARWSLPLAGRVAVRAPRGLPVVQVDADVLVHALRNLLENAVKYSPEGAPIELDASCRGRMLTLSVADAGPGVPSAERAAIFAPFQRGARAAGDGAGLGLAIAARAAAAHRGVLTHADRAAAGSVFTLSLPVARASRSA